MEGPGALGPISASVQPKAAQTRTEVLAWPPQQLPPPAKHQLPQQELPGMLQQPRHPPTMPLACTRQLQVQAQLAPAQPQQPPTAQLQHSNGVDSTHTADGADSADPHAPTQQQPDADDEDDEDEFFDNEDDGDVMCCTMDDTPAMIQAGLFIGSFLAEQNRSKLQQHHITHILQVADGLTPSHPQHFKYMNVEVMDAPGEDLVAHFERAFKFIDQAIAAQGAVLVHCVAGVSRSSTICIGWLMRTHRIGYDEAFRRVHQVRPWVMPNPGFRRQLALFEEQECDTSKWRAWRHTHPQPPGAVISLAGLTFTRNTPQGSSSTSSAWMVHAAGDSQREQHKHSATYMPELGTSL